MRLLVDEDTQSHLLLRLLRESGHDVVAVAELGMNGATDEAVLARAVADDRVGVTRNCDDFLAVYQDDDDAKHMSYDEIARAVGRVEASTLPTEGQFLALNAWRPAIRPGRTRTSGRARR